jgi:Protein of unknown function (DUF1353)
MIKVEIINLARKEFRVLDDYFVVVNEEEDKVRIPRDFVTDLASIPSFLFWLQWGSWNKAAIVHDYLYSHGFIYLRTADSPFEYKAYFNRQKADELFYSILRFYGVNLFLAYGMFVAVRIFGANKYWLTNV